MVQRDGVRRAAERPGNEGGAAAQGISLRPAERSPMGIRLPGGLDRHVLQWRYGGRSGQGRLVQGQLQGDDPPGRRKGAQCLGTLRHAGQSLAVVFGLVRPASRRQRHRSSGSLHRPATGQPRRKLGQFSRPLPPGRSQPRSRRGAREYCPRVSARPHSGASAPLDARLAVLHSGALLAGLAGPSFLNAGAPHEIELRRGSLRIVVSDGSDRGEL